MIQVPAGVRLLAGSAEALPAADADADADFLRMGYALRHIGNLSAAFAEFHRVLRPGGRLCVLEITQPERPLPRLLLKAYLCIAMPAVAAVVARHRDMPDLMRYYCATIAACVPPRVILGALDQAGSVDVNRGVEHGVFSEYRARKPH